MAEDRCPNQAQYGNIALFVFINQMSIMPDALFWSEP
jgi:hypothetical protein